MRAVLRGASAGMAAAGLGIAAAELFAAATRPDWHNARARLMLDLNARLEALPSDAAREALLENLANTIAAGRAVDLAQGALPAAAPV